MDLVLWQRLRDEVLAFGTVCFDVKKKKLDLASVAIATTSPEGSAPGHE